MPPTAKKSTTAKTAAAKPTTDDLGALRAEVAAEASDSSDDYIALAVGDTTLRIKQFLDWPASASEFLSVGRFSMWAQRALHPDDAAMWLQIDPTHRQVVELFRNWEKITGIPLGSTYASLMS